MAISIADQEEALGRWPRRLLRVSDLTSFEWQPGNTYGGVQEPAYNAITYTWGRWSLLPGTQPDVKALPIQEVPWKVPRVHPDHFTIQHFRDVIQAASSLTLEEDQIPVQFIWLDVACIDQRNTPQTAAEIGRQGLIFRGAQCVFMWLTSLSPGKDYDIFGNIEWFLTPASEHTHESVASVFASLDSFLDVLDDPWFSSLWTLQEAYLSPDAIVLTQNGSTAAYDLYGSQEILNLRQILVWAENMDGFCTQRARLDPTNSIFPEMKTVLEERGLVALGAHNTMALLSAATNRKTVAETDRIYGIQQVFDLRLGKSSVAWSPGRPETLADLEDELGAALLKAEPLLSQSHVLMRPVPYQHRWRIQACSSVPSNLLQYTESRTQRQDGAPPGLREPEPPSEVKCSLWVDEAPLGAKPVHWRGRTVALGTLLDFFKKRENDTGEQITAQIFPDYTDEFVASSFHKEPAHSSPIAKGEVSYRFGRYLVKTYLPTPVRLLLLGIAPKPNQGGCALGLILRGRPDGDFERLGLCQWWLPDAGNVWRRRLEGVSGEWKTGEGVFGYIYPSAF